MFLVAFLTWSSSIIVFDVGGGTFDVNILTIENGVFEVLSTNGKYILCTAMKGNWSRHKQPAYSVGLL